MKVIDLLNKIANEEEVPKRIKYGNAIYDYDEDLRDYVQLDYLRFSLFTHDKEYSITDILNNEVEIIEEQEEKPKLQKLRNRDKYNDFSISPEIHSLKNKINEIIDYINEGKNE